ncbi:MAG: M6 family metalloprotease domain-containing protein [Candidatus Zixiibacteriota bacterium]
MKSRYMIKYAVLLLWLALIYPAAYAVPPSPEVIEKLKAEGIFDDFVNRLNDARSRGMDAPAAIKAKDKLATDINQVDTVRVLVILVDFSDKPYTAGAIAATPPLFDSVLFSEGKNPSGSMTEYYLENSYGTFFIIGDVYGWFRMPEPMSYYSPYGTNGIGSYPNNAQRLAEIAVDSADDYVDFSVYDSWGLGGGPDGKVDGLFVVHAGTGFEESGDEAEIHSHKWHLSVPQTRDGVEVYNYTMEPEESDAVPGISPIGVFCHEYGHFIGLPDLYDIADIDNTSAGLGRWSLMGSGSYNNNSRTPAHFDAFSKIAAGFVTETNVTGNLVNAPIPQVETNPVIYRLWSDGTYGLQYFLVENRQLTGFDAYLPGEGLLIYHVYDILGDADGNNSGIPYRVALEQADGLRNLEFTLYNDGDAGDPWPGSVNKRSFDDLSVPDSRGYGPTITEVSVWNISDPDSVMYANLDIRWSRPYIALDSLVFVDEHSDGFFDPGETVQVFFFIKNLWLTAANANFTLSSNDPSININNPSVFRSSLTGDGASANNISSPLSFVVPDTITPTYDSFFLDISTDGGTYTNAFAVEKVIGRPQVLIVDDDRGDSYEDIYFGDLYAKRIPADIWEKRILGAPPGPFMNNYRMVFWFTGDTASGYLQAADITSIKTYLDNGGNLFLTGQDLADKLRVQDSLFLENYLHARYGGAGFSIYHDGIAGSPVGEGIAVRYFSGNNQIFTSSDKIIPVNGALPAFKFRNQTNYSALTYDNNYKLVFFNFGYEGLQEMPSAGFVRRDSLMSRIISFFGSFTTDIKDDNTSRVLPQNFVLRQNYPNPFNPTTRIDYTLKAVTGAEIPNTNIRVYNILGQEIRTLVDRKELPGNYSVEWDGTDRNGVRVASGIYFYRLTRGADKETRKMVLLK